MELLQMSVRTLSEKIRTKALGVEETVSVLQKRIEETDPELCAFLTIEKEQVAHRVEEVQKGIKSGIYAGPLAGVPVAVKDNICTKGLRTTCASKMLENFVPAYDATVITRLQDAGMIVLGKTNMDEFAMGSTTETSASRVTKNPWNTHHVPGGSSGGSCAAVAAGMAPLALGSDTGGSVRQPAAFCGVVGLKPTYGRVSRYGLVAYASSMDQIGPIGQTVADCKALYEVIAGFDEKDATSVNKEINPSAIKDRENRNDMSYMAGACPDEMCIQRLKGMRIGVPREYFGEGVSPEVRASVKAAATLLEANGAVVEELSLPMTDYAVAAYYIIACGEASSNLARFDGVKYGYRTAEAGSLHELYKKSRTGGFGEEVKRRILSGSFLLSEGYYDAYYLKALKVRRLIKEEYESVFRRYDCLLTPTAPGTAPKLSESLQNPLRMYQADVNTVAVNLAGLPAISVPCGFDKNGLPIGVQFIGNAFCEETLFTVAEAYEVLRGEFPKVWKQQKNGQKKEEWLGVPEKKSAGEEGNGKAGGCDGI